jgi:hypothetical protein
MRHRAFWLVILTAGVASCLPAPEFDRALHSTDSERIQDLRALMTRHGIPYRDTERGGLSWRSKDEAQVANLRNQLDKSTSVKYNDPEARKHLVKLLADAKQDYIVKERPDGTWIMWFPKSNAEADELQMKVAQHLFETQRGKSSGECPPNSAAPSNSTLETDARQVQPRAAQCGR